MPDLSILYSKCPIPFCTSHVALPIPRQVHRLSRQDRPFVGQNSTKQQVETDHPSCWARRLLLKKTRGPCGWRAHHIGLSDAGSAFQDHLWPFLWLPCPFPPPINWRHQKLLLILSSRIGLGRSKGGHSLGLAIFTCSIEYDNLGAHPRYFMWYVYLLVQYWEDECLLQHFTATSLTSMLSMRSRTKWGLSNH